MLILLTIFAILLAVSIVVFARRRTSYLLQERPQKNLSASGFRPLFEPGTEELRAAEREEQKALEAARQEESKRNFEEKFREFEAARSGWRAGPSRKNTIELLYLASERESGMIYAELTGEIIKVWKNGQIENLSADDLSQLLESHFWLLPAKERTSGVSFSILEEIAGLRRKGHEDN
jgi:hypothetical protein